MSTFLWMNYIFVFWRTPLGIDFETVFKLNILWRYPFRNFFIQNCKFYFSYCDKNSKIYFLQQILSIVKITKLFLRSPLIFENDTPLFSRHILHRGRDPSCARRFSKTLSVKIDEACCKRVMCFPGSPGTAGSTTVV